MLPSNDGNLWSRGKDGEEETGSLGRVNICRGGHRRGPEELEEEGIQCKKLRDQGRGKVKEKRQEKSEQQRLVGSKRWWPRSGQSGQCDGREVSRSSREGRRLRNTVEWKNGKARRLKVAVFP